MGLKLGDVLILFKGDERGLDDSFASSKKKSKSWASGVGSTISTAIGVAMGNMAVMAGQAIIGAAQDGMKAFADFDKGMNEVFTLMPGITGMAMAQMRGQALGLAKEMGILPEDVVPALYQALSAGVPPDNVFDFLAKSNKAALGGVTELETAVDGISSVVNAYGAETIGAGKASDLMFTAVRLGKTNFEELSNSLFNVIPTAASLGVEFGDITAAMATMTAQGVPTSVATTQMRQMFVELSKEGNKTAEVFEETAGVSFRQFIAEGGNVADALEILQIHAEDNDMSISDLFGSVEAGNAALSLSGKNLEGYRDNLVEMANSTGATDKAFEQMDQGVSRSADRMKASFQAFLIGTVDEFSPWIEQLAGLAEEWLPLVTDAIGGMAEKLQSFLADDPMGAMMNLIPPEILEGLEGIGGAFQEAFGAISEWFAEYGPGIQETLTTLFSLVVEKGQEVITNILPFIQEQIEKFGEWFTENGPLINEFIQKQAERWGTIMTVLLDFWDVVLPILDGLFTGILNFAELIMLVSTEDWPAAWEAMKTLVSEAWEDIKEIFNKFADWILTNFLGTTWESVKTTWKTNWEMLQTILEVVWKEIKTKLLAAWTEIKTQFDEKFAPIKELAKKVADAVANILSQAKTLWTWLQEHVFTFQITKPDMSIPGGYVVTTDNEGEEDEEDKGPQALGGDYIVTKPTWFLAGEAGAERALFQPVGGGRSNPAWADDEGGGSGTVIEIHETNYFQDAPAIEELERHHFELVELYG